VKFCHLGYFLKARGEIWFVLGILRGQKGFDVDVFEHPNLALKKMFWHLWFGNCLGYFIQNLGEFFPNILVTLVCSWQTFLPALSHLSGAPLEYTFASLVNIRQGWNS
jgi:hypothetical protein